MKQVICDHCGNADGTKGVSSFDNPFGSWHVISDPSGAAKDRHFCKIDCIHAWTAKIIAARKPQEEAA